MLVSKNVWIIYAALSAIFAALVGVFGKIGVKHIDSTLATTIRAVLMAVFLIVVALGTHKFVAIKQLDSKALIFLVFAGIAGALSWLAYFYALQRGPLSGVAVIDRMSVVLAVVLGWMVFGEALTWKSAAGIVCMVAGLLLFIV